MLEVYGYKVYVLASRGDIGQPLGAPVTIGMSHASLLNIFEMFKNVTHVGVKQIPNRIEHILKWTNIFNLNQ